ncbi:hypothetical protein [Salinibacter ruber]|uniref:hypothetical protein n=1 Tax=Salinibacter ruber TaxID=146919 RepID=UPI0021681E7A|nr:hypothetical protein [Salinibacter ruber]MCS4058425.1 hypothetical protein [Salinibacter ruber]
MATLFMFVVGGYGISNVVHLFPQAFPTGERFFPRFGYEWLVPATLLSFVALVAMWNGYHSSVGTWLARRLRSWSSTWRFMRSSIQVRWGVVVALTTLSIAARLLEVRLGVYGYTSSEASRLRYISLLQYVEIFSGLGTLALAAAGLSYFAHPSKKKWGGIVVAGILVVELVFGLLSGYKSQVVLPFVVVGVCYYLGQGKVMWKAVAAAILAVVIAYIAIEPFRIYYNNNTEISNTDILSISRVMVDVATGDIDPQVSSALSLERIAKRIAARRELTGFTALSMKHKHEEGKPERATYFTSNIFLSPAYAVIPRALWPSKPKANLGRWYNREIIKSGVTNSVGMGPLSYLWFAGGWIAVILGFWLIGVFQNVAYNWLLLSGGGFLILYFSIVTYLVKVNSEFYITFITLIRNIPMAIIVQYIVFKD